MEIQWNVVTWYSKALAVVLFVGVAVGAFLLGREYERVIPLGGEVDMNSGQKDNSAKGQLALHIGEEKSFGDLTLRLDKILHDSRCPIDVQCIQAGSVIAEVRYSQGVFSSSFHIGTDDQSIQFHGYTVTLKDVQPDPISTKEIQLSDYLLVFNVDRGELADPINQALIEKAKNAEYMIDQSKIKLSNGVFTKALLGGNSKEVVQYFGNEAIGDVNGDGVDDLAFLLTHTAGGTGTFYYVAAILSGSTGFVGTDAVFIGDRIAPQSTEIQGGRIVVNYADHGVNEPMGLSPSIGKSLYLVVQDGQLIKQ